MRDRSLRCKVHQVRAMLDDRQTQLRMPLKPQPPVGMRLLGITAAGKTAVFVDDIPQFSPNADTDIKLPYQPGDRLWVRETWAENEAPAGGIIYRAEHFNCTEYLSFSKDGTCAERVSKWRPSTHMPRWASRITLLVDDVKVQRLQDISEGDAEAEGATARPNVHGYKNLHTGWRMDWPAVEPENGWGQISLGSARMAFANTWNTLYPEQSWDANPWVVALTFRVIKQNIDQIERNAA